jgi:hypothetical protein
VLVFSRLRGNACEIFFSFGIRDNKVAFNKGAVYVGCCSALRIDSHVLQSAIHGKHKARKYRKVVFESMSASPGLFASEERENADAIVAEDVLNPVRELCPDKTHALVPLAINTKF